MNTFSANEDVLHALFEASVLGILVVGHRGTIVMANPYGLRLFGYSEEELIGQPLDLLIPLHLKEEHAKLRKSFFANPQVRPMGIGRRLHGLRQNGEQFPIEVSLSHMEVDGQRYAIAFVADVTEHQQTQQLNISLTRLFHESLNCIYIIDLPTLRFIRANRGGFNYLGYTSAELQQLHPWDIKKGEDEATFRQRVAPLLAEAVQKITFESIFVRKDGRTYPVEVHLQRFQYNVQPVLMQIVIDITKRKEAEAALQREKDTAQMYLDVAASIFMVVERDHTVSLVNQYGCKVLGYPESEIIGKDWFTHFVLPTERARTRAVFDQLMREETEDVAHFENYVMSRDRGGRLIEWRNTIIRSSAGAPVATLSSGIDITEKRKAEQAVTQALIEGQEAERRRIAQELHDGLGQSLTAIRLHLNALESDVSHFAQKNQEALEKVKLILQTTTQEVKAISRDLMPNVLKDYGLVKALEFLAQTINDTNQVRVELQVYGLEHEPDQARKVGLYRVAQELINNALKHAEATQIDVQLVKHATSVVLTVEDNGRGFNVPAEDSPRSSFGLRNIETRVKFLDGTFEIDSRLGTGTSVTVEIPLT